MGGRVSDVIVCCLVDCPGSRLSTVVVCGVTCGLTCEIIDNVWSHGLL